MSENLHFVIIWHRLGPYHRARLRELSRRVTTTIIEMCEKDVTYAWDTVEMSGSGVRRITLFQGLDCDEVPAEKVITKLNECLDDVKPDVLFIPSWGTNYALCALDWSIRRKCSRVVFSDSAAGDKPRSKLAEFVKRKIVSNYSAGFVAGSKHVEYLAQLGLPADQVWTGYDCVDNGYFAEGARMSRLEEARYRQELAVPPEYFLTVCRFIKKKNVSFLLSEFAAFVKLRGGAQGLPSLVLVGDGPLRDKLKSEAASLGIENLVCFVGFKQYDETPAFYGLASAFILTSLEEQWGLVVNEAMACGLPVLVSNRCNCTADLVVEGENGYTFDPERLGSLCALLDKIHMVDTDLRLEMGKRSSEIVSKFSLEVFAKNVVAAGTEALLRKQRSSFLSRLLLQLLMRRRNRPDH